MEKITRRQFLVRTGATVSLLQLQTATAGIVGNDPPKSQESIHYLTESGADLYLHLINTHECCGNLVPVKHSDRSYLIVQIPPQSLHEQYFFTGSNDAVPNSQLKAILSGPSFLAFELWPSKKRRRRMPFNVESLLNWEDLTNFRLLTADDIPIANWPQLDTKCGCSDLHWDPNNLGSGGIYDLAYYRDLTTRLLNKNPNCYLSIFELPAGIITVPINHYRPAVAPVSPIVLWTPIVRQNMSGGADKRIYESVYKLSKHDQTLTRSVRECWNAEIEFLPTSQQQVTPKVFERLPPALRIIGLIDRENADYNSIGCDPVHPDPCSDPSVPDPTVPGFLPTLLDKAELLYLNQLGKDYIRTSAFDLVVTGPFLLTSIGTSLKFHYRQFNTKNLGDKSISLVEYEHHFQDGRDNFIKVSRIGVICPSGQKALHVRVARRKIHEGRSFLEYKEYIEFIEQDKDYSPSRDTDPVKWQDTEYLHIQLPAAEDQLNPGKNFFRRLPFTSSEVLVKRTPNMQPVKGNINSFWVYREQPLGVALVEDYSELIQVPIQYYDQNKTKIGKPSSHPILFMARSFFCGSAGQDWVTGNLPGGSSSLQLNEDRRNRIPLNGQVVAFTPDNTIEAADQPDKDSSNRLNQLATDWCEYLVLVAAPSLGSDSVFDTAKHPIYPQLRRAKVFIDHLQQYGQRKLPSIVSFEQPYLDNGIDNSLQVFLRHANDFTNGGLVDLFGNRIDGNPKLAESDLNNAWNDIQSSFASAASQLGGLVNPDPGLKRLSLSSSALSLPDGIPDLKTLDPQKFFDKLNAELFCGIRLKDILNVLSEGTIQQNLDNLPQYVLGKIPSDFSDPQSALAAIGGNPILQNVINDVETTEAIIKQAQTAVNEATAALAKAQDEYNHLGDLLKNQLPDFNKFLDAARLKFESEISAYQKSLTVDKLTVLMVMELIKSRQDFSLENIQQKLTDFLVTKVQQILSDAAFTQSWMGLELATELDDLLSDLTAPTSEILIWANAFDPIVFAPTTEQQIFDLAYGFLLGPDKLPDPAKLLAGNKFYRRTKPLTKLFAIIQNRLNDTERQIWIVGLRQIDLMGRTAVNYFAAERDRKVKDVEDILRTAKVQLADEQAVLQSIATSGLAYTTQILDLYHTGADALATLNYLKNPEHLKAFLNTATSNFEASVRTAIQNSPYYKTLADNIDAYSKLTNEINGYKKDLENASKALVEKVQSGAKAKLDDLEQKFNERIAQLKDTSEIQQALEAYTKLKQILTALKRQELKLDWVTEKFKPADLGFVQFTPSTAPATRLEMKVRAVVEMDPLKFPPVVQHTEVSTETSLTDFSIMFFNVIGVKFSKVAFSAGTNSNSNLDVKISDVVFGGGLSFIQLLQKLLSGLIEGLRLELGPDFVSLGYQSPTLDISSPGFTFANFSVGLLLRISFAKQPSPLRLTFRLAQPDKKATVAATVYGGCFYCAMTLDPKQGIVEIEMALEMGAYIGISFGPFKGYVKFMVGLFYKKDEQGVTLEGYLIAEGLLSVWIISVSARLYMGVRSQNSYVQGFCVASYTVQVGFLSKTFTASYTKTVSGAASNAPTGTQSRTGVLVLNSVASVLAQNFADLGGLNRSRHSSDAFMFDVTTAPGYDYKDQIADVFRQEETSMSEQQFMEFVAGNFAVNN